MALAYRNTMAIAALMKTGGIPEAPRGIGRSRDPGTHYCATQQRRSVTDKLSLFVAADLGRLRVTTAMAVQDTLWNLRTWPLEWVEWATNNTHRLDIYFQKDSHSRDSGLLTTPLPNNERNQASCSVILLFFWGGRGQ